MQTKEKTSEKVLEIAYKVIEKKMNELVDRFLHEFAHLMVLTDHAIRYSTNKIVEKQFEEERKANVARKKRSSKRRI